jgi:hypothetical protein
MIALGAALCIAPSEARSSAQGDSAAVAERSLEETRLAMGKWIETEKIISLERNEWQQGKEILAGRLELVKQEIALLEVKLQEAQTSVTEVERKRGELAAEGEELKAAGAQLADVVARLEQEVRRLYQTLPGPLQEKLEPLHGRIPTDPSGGRASTPERFQNVLGILNEVNKANNEISVTYEVHTMGDGRPAEVQAVYVGLAQAYYVGAEGEAGIGRPSANGWQWEPSDAVSRDVLKALDILEGKHSPAFIPLPVKIQ